MKKNIYSLFLLLINIISANGQSSDREFNGQSNQLNISSAIIDSLDTVFFDMAQATIVLNSIQIPVYILSNDTINALDFAFKYDHNNLSYDSIANLANYIQAYSYYNSSDSTVRYTSNSMHVYANDSALAGIHFTMINGNILLSDINSVVAYLNGDPCSVKIIGLLPNFINETVKENEFTKIISDPADKLLHVVTNEMATIQVFDLNGQRCIYTTTSPANNTDIDTKGIPTGVYLIRISCSKYVSVKKVIIE